MDIENLLSARSQCYGVLVNSLAVYPESFYGIIRIVRGCVFNIEILCLTAYGMLHGCTLAML